MTTDKDVAYLQHWAQTLARSSHPVDNASGAHLAMVLAERETLQAENERLSVAAMALVNDYAWKNHLPKDDPSQFEAYADVHPVKMVLAALNPEPAK